jgi:hypothetical protein
VYSGADTTTGNSIIGSSVILDFVNGSETGSYLVAIPEPKSVALVFGCFMAALLVVRRHRS